MNWNEVSLTGTDWRSLSKKVLITALLGAGLALVLEPDHTSNLPVLAAFGLWMTHILFAAALFLAGFWAAQHSGLPGPIAAIISAVILPVLFAPVSLLLDLGFGNPDEELASAGSFFSVYASEVVSVAPVALAVALAVVYINYRSSPKQKGQTGPLAVR